jgi:hypothetical protein
MIRILVSIILIISVSYAQESFDPFPMHGSVGISAGRIRQTNFKSNIGSYQSQWTSLHTVVPVYHTVELTDEERSFQQISLTGSLRRNTTDLTLIREARIITTGSLGVSWFYIGESKNLYSISGTVGISEDKLLATSKELRFQATAFGSYHLSDPLNILYGLNYSALFGQDRLLPMLGVRWKLGDDWSTSIILPFSFSLRYRANSTIILRLAIRAAGERMRISNQNDFAVLSNDLQLRMTGVNNSLRCGIKLSDDFGMNIELGSITRRSIEILSGSSTLFTTNVNPARYLSVGVRYRFSTGFTTELE